MQGYIAPVTGTSDTVRRILLEEPIGIFRSDDEVLAMTPHGEVDIGIRDMTVSRQSDGQPPVEFIPKSDAIEILNRSNSNTVTVDTGVLKHELEAGQTSRVKQDATVDVGYNTSLRVTVEREHTHKTLTKDELADLGLRITESSSLMEGVAPASYVQSVADNLRKARSESPNECLKYATELHTFVTEHPIENSTHNALRDDLGRIVDRLNQKVSSSALRGTDLDEEWIDEIDRIAHRAERLYSNT